MVRGSSRPGPILTTVLPGLAKYRGVFSPDGRRAVAGSSLDGDGQIHIYDTGYDPTVSDELKKVFGK